MSARRNPEPALQSLGLIARGGQGSVLLVYQRAQRRFLALKIIRLRGDIAAARRRLQRQQDFASGSPDPWLISPEASGLGSEAPPEIAALVAAEGFQGEWLWLLMPYVHGPNALELALGDGRFGWAEVSALCAQVAARLARRPEGQAHLDLKPENIPVDLGGRSFLVDQQFDHEAGTSGYAAPEQRSEQEEAGFAGGRAEAGGRSIRSAEAGFAGGRAEAGGRSIGSEEAGFAGGRAEAGGRSIKTTKPDGRADLFALGRTCQRLLARSPPKPTDPPDMVPPWPELPEDMPPEKRRFARELVQLVRELCSPDPAERGDVQEVARRFLEVAIGLGGPDLAATLKASIARANLPERLELFAQAMASQPKAAELLLPVRKGAGLRQVPWPAVVLAVVGTLAMASAYHWGWIGAHPAVAEPAPIATPTAIGDADPLGSDAFGPDHYAAEMTDLGQGRHADKMHGYVRVHARSRVLSAAIWRSDESPVWYRAKPLGNYPLDLAPGTYIFVQQRPSPLGRSAEPAIDRQPFVVHPGDKIVLETEDVPEFAPSP